MTNTQQFVYNLPRGSEGSPVAGTSYYENLDSDALDTARLSIRDQLIYIFNAQGDFLRAVDPSSTTTPVQDAIDIINADGTSRWSVKSGTIILPSGTITEAGTLTGLGGVQLVGQGVLATELAFTDTTADGISVASLSDGRRVYLDQLALSGDDRSARNGSGTAAIRWTDGVDRFNMGQVAFEQWEDVFVMQNGGHPFSSTWETVHSLTGTGRGMVFDGSAPNNLHIGQLMVKNNNNDKFFDTPSGALGNIALTIDSLISGGSTGQVLVRANSGTFAVRNFHHEGGGTSDLMRFSGNAHCRVERVRVISGAHDYVLEQDGANAGNNFLGSVYVGGGTINTNTVHLRNTADLYSEFWGTTAEVDNPTGGTNGTFFCKKSQAFADV